jgi:hypothetical protein
LTFRIAQGPYDASRVRNFGIGSDHQGQTAG